MYAHYLMNAILLKGMGGDHTSEKSRKGHMDIQLLVAQANTMNGVVKNQILFHRHMLFRRKFHQHFKKRRLYFVADNV